MRGKMRSHRVAMLSRIPHAKSAFSSPIQKKYVCEYKGVNLVAKSIFDQFRRGQPRRQPRGQPKRQKSWRFGVSESGNFSEILLKKMVV